MNISSSLTGIALAASALLTLPVSASTSPDISGDWMRADGKTRVHIAPCGPQICAVSTWIRDKSGDEQVGDRLVMTLEAQSATALVGDAFDVKRNRNYSLKISFVGPDTMQTRGCMMKGIVCKTANWTRAGVERVGGARTSRSALQR
jgi:uncharacterized protein (DUF2147 family)